MALDSTKPAIYCSLEGRAFPPEEFHTDPDFGRVHTPADGTSSHTIMGDPVDGGDWELEKLGGA